VVDSDTSQQVLVDYALWRMAPQTVASNRRQPAMIWLTCVAASYPEEDSRKIRIRPIAFNQLLK